MPLIIRYAIITLTPAVFIVFGAFFGGVWPALALIWLTVLTAGMDQILPDARADDRAEPWATRLSIGLAILHLALIPTVLAGLGNPNTSFGAQILLFFATASFMGQVSHANAHDLIHRRDRRLFALGAAVYASILYGHHVSAHRMVHHAHVGTPEDPATPRHGEGFWSYVARAWPGNIAAGWEAEVARLSRRNLPIWSQENPYLFWLVGAVLSLAVAVMIGGFLGLVVFLLLIGLVHLQMLLSDYIQHYGLQRLRLPGGRVEPVGPHHSWDAPSGFSALLLMNAPRHSEHHRHPDRPYQALGSAEPGPRLPYPLPIMAVLAVFPPLWQRVMDRRALKVMEAAKARLGIDDSVAPGDVRKALIG
ncbi:MAG: alkane 1-monooxygenase [Pseudomonadota bacterium]